MVQILELFGGIGSPRCALRNLNIPTKAIDYVEIDENAVRSYNAMFAEELEYKTQSVVGWNPVKYDVGNNTHYSKYGRMEAKICYLGKREKCIKRLQQEEL